MPLNLKTKKGKMEQNLIKYYEAITQEIVSHLSNINANMLFSMLFVFEFFFFYLFSRYLDINIFCKYMYFHI